STAKSEALGPGEAIPDEDAAIKVMESLRETLRAQRLGWPLRFQDDLANAYMNRAATKQKTIGPAASIPDYDTAIKLMQDLRSMLLMQGLGWPPQFQRHLALAYSNRAAANREFIGPAEAITDSDTAIMLGEDLRDALRRDGLRWPPEFQSQLA